MRAIKKEEEQKGQTKRFAGFFEEHHNSNVESSSVKMQTEDKGKEKTPFVTLRVTRATWMRMKRYQLETGMNLTEIMEDALSRYLPDK